MNDFEFGQKYAEEILKGNWNGGGSNAGIIAEVVRDYIKEGKFGDIKKRITLIQIHQKNLKHEGFMDDFSRGVFSVLEIKLIEILKASVNRS